MLCKCGARLKWDEGAFCTRCMFAAKVASKPAPSADPEWLRHIVCVRGRLGPVSDLLPGLSALGLTIARTTDVPSAESVASGATERIPNQSDKLSIEERKVLEACLEWTRSLNYIERSQRQQVLWNLAFVVARHATKK